MNFSELVNSRYTAKQYIETKKIPEVKINQLKEILQLSPSSINSQPWKFIFVSDEKVKRELAKAFYFNQQKINEAIHLVVFSVVDDIDKFEQRINQTLPEGNLGYYNSFLKPLPQSEVKAWLKHQVYLSLGFFLSACASFGIDSTPMEGIQNEAYDSILKLDGYKSLFAVAIGYRNPEDTNQPSKNPKSRLPLEQIILSV